MLIWEDLNIPLIKCIVGIWLPIVFRNCQSNNSVNIDITDSTTQQVPAASYMETAKGYTYSVSHDMDPTFSSADTGDKVQDFFERQVLIKTFQWQVGVPLFEQFNPWTLFFENRKVINRLINFKLLRANLHVKFLVNGNAFYYGRAMASYIPLHLYDQHTRIREGIQADLVEASQRPHIYIDPTTSTGGELVLPYFYPRNAMIIPEREWERMGQITLTDLNTLSITTDNTDPITISVFAFATEVDVSVPTSAVPLVFDNQSDEYSSNPISRPATFVASVASSLSNSPIIGPFMRATEIAARATAGIAQIFGYSKPTSQIVSPYVNMGNRFMATSSPTSVATPLSIDPKKEVTIDPRTTGLSAKDELGIAELASRESYITTFQWTSADTVGDLLWNSYVEPNMHREVFVDDQLEIHMAPSCLVSCPFEYWRGSMEFRFQVVCSKYHKGRLRIVWDPEFQQTNEYNVNYQTILDISECTDHTFKVGWGASTLYLPCEHMAFNQIPYSTDSLVAPRGNGTLSVFVINDLTTPTAVPADIEINVFTRMCDDFELICPTGNAIGNMTILPPLPSGLNFPIVSLLGYYVSNVSVQTLAGLNYPLTEGRLEFAPTFGGTVSFDLDFKNINNVDGSREIGFDFTVQMDSITASTQVSVIVDGTTYLFDLQPGTNKIKVRHLYSWSASDPNSVLLSCLIAAAGFVAGTDEMTIDRVYLPVQNNTEYQLVNVSDTRFTLAGSAVYSTYGGDTTIDMPSPSDSCVFNGFTKGGNPIIVFGVPDGGVLQYNASDTITFTPAAGGWSVESVIASGGDNNATFVGATAGTLGYIYAPVEVYDNESMMEDSTNTGIPPIGPSATESMGSLSFNQMANSICAGESIGSLRPLLKRFDLRATSATPIVDATLFTLVPNDSSFGESTRVTLLKLLMASFVGYRGSMRFLVTTRSQNTRGVVVRYTKAWDGALTFPDTLDNPFINLSGAFEFNTVGNYPEFEVPWYCPYRFQFCRRTSNSDDETYAIEATKFLMSVEQSDVRIYTAIGEDFNLFFFLSTPVVLRSTV